MEIDKKEYGKYVKQVTPVHNTGRNLWRAFLVGGLICMLGQVFTSVYMSFGIGKESAAAWTTLSLIGLSVILTGLHLYRKIVEFGGAGHWCRSQVSRIPWYPRRSNTRRKAMSSGSAARSLRSRGL